MPLTKIQSLNLQRAITPKIVGVELWFLYTALLHNVTYLCIKFEVTSFSTLEVMPQTRFRDARMDGQTDRVTPVYPPNFVYGGIIKAVALTVWDKKIF